MSLEQLESELHDARKAGNTLAELLAYRNEVHRLHAEKLRLRVLVAQGLGIAEGCGFTNKTIQEFIREAEKEIES